MMKRIVSIVLFLQLVAVCAAQDTNAVGLSHYAGKDLRKLEKPPLLALCMEVREGPPIFACCVRTNENVRVKHGWPQKAPPKGSDLSKVD